MLAKVLSSALVGIGQYSILHYDNLGQRPEAEEPNRRHRPIRLTLRRRTGAGAERPLPRAPAAWEEPAPAA